jgi:hypothetical protein
MIMMVQGAVAFLESPGHPAATHLFCRHHRGVRERFGMLICGAFPAVEQKSGDPDDSIKAFYFFLDREQC